MDILCAKDKTCHFWYEYLTTNCLVYMALFVALINGDWVLRIAAIKSMAALFCAFDRPTYQRLIPQHLADLLCFPQIVLEHLQKGAFTVHLTDGNGHAVGLDEAHEMCINKDSKFAVVRPSPDIMEKIANFMPFRSKCLSTLKKQLGMEKQLSNSTIPTTTSRDRTADTNIQVMLDMMDECDIISTASSEPQLRNPFTNVVAAPEQMHDLLNFRQVGQTEFEHYISYRILCTPSTDAPRRRKRLQTFGSAKYTTKN